MSAFLKIDSCAACNGSIRWEWVDEVILSGKRLPGTGVWRSQLVDGVCPACLATRSVRHQNELRAAKLRQDLITLLGGSKPYREFTLDRFQVEPGNRLAFDQSQRFNPAKGNLYLWGSCGVGKTHLAYACARRCFEEMPSVEIVQAGQLSRRVRMKDPDQEQATIDRFTSANVLVLDDLGNGPDTPFARQILQEILDARSFKDRAGLIFTSKILGDSIILEGIPSTTLRGQGQRTPCLNTDDYICPSGPPVQMVIQIENARGTNGSPLIAASRNLADHEFWDFVPLPGSQPYPTQGFKPVATADDLSNQLSTAGWGSVILVSSPKDCVVTDTATGEPMDIGGCLDLSAYPPLSVPAGVTIRGDRRGLNFGSQLYFSYKEWQKLNPDVSRPGSCNDKTCMLEVHGDYVRISRLRLRGESRAMDKSEDKTIAIQVDYPGGSAKLPAPLFNLGTVTHFIATIDHNDGSDWGESPLEAKPVFTYDPNGKPNRCSYGPSSSSTEYLCDEDAINEGVPYPNSASRPVPYHNDPATFANIRIARNFLHHNMRFDGGYGASVRGRALIEQNTFSWNRHDISADAEPHNEYHALNNLVLSGAPNYGVLGLPGFGRLQDFDMHGTDNPGTDVGGAGGYYVEIGANTFLGGDGDGQDYVLRGWPIVASYYHDNVSRRKENDAIHFIHCKSLGCINDYTADEFPIAISNSIFGQTSPDPTSRLGVGDFDGDGAEDLFLATGNTWFYSPGGQREWRYLNSAHDSIGQLLLGDFDGDGRTDVVGLRDGHVVVSWGGISAFEVLNYGPLPCSSMTDMAVGDFDGDGHPDIFCADGGTWWISYGGNTPFVQVIVADSTRVKDLRFGDFNGDGTTDVFGAVNGRFTSPHWQVRFAPKGYQGVLGGWEPMPVTLSNTANGLIVADFNGDGVADVGRWCGSNDGANAGWEISYGASLTWSACNSWPAPANNTLFLANGAVGHFSGGSGADILLWDYTNSQGAAPLWVVPGGTRAPYTLSSQDMH